MFKIKELKAVSIQVNQHLPLLWYFSLQDNSFWLLPQFTYQHDMASSRLWSFLAIVRKPIHVVVEAVKQTLM